MATPAFNPEAAAASVASQLGASNPSEAASGFDPGAAAAHIAQSLGAAGPQQAAPTAVPQGLSQAAATQSPDSQDQEGLITKGWNWLNSSPIEKSKTFQGAVDWAKGMAEKEGEQQNWWKSFAANFFAGSADDAAKLLTPINAALAVTTGGEGTAAESLANVLGASKIAEGLKSLPSIATVAKGLKNLALGYFGIQSAEDVWQKQQADESTPDYLQRVLFGASGLLGTTAAAGDAVHNEMVKKLGLNEDLASRVQVHLENIKQVRDLSKFYDQYDWLRKAEHEANLEEAKVRLSRIPQDVDREAAQFQQDFRHAVGL